MNSEIIKYAQENNLIITEEGFRLLNIYNYKTVIDKLAEEKKIFVTPQDISIIISDNNKNIKTNTVTEEKTISKDIIKNFKILDKYDVTNKNYSQGKVEDFHKLFLDKYDTLSNIIKKRVDFKYVSIKDAKKEIKNKEVDIIGMVYEKRLTKNGNLLVVVDDPSGKVNLVVMNKDDDEFMKLKESILLDNVLGFKCGVLSKDIFIVNEILFPDLPFITKVSTVREDAYMAIIGDVHVGSNLFLEEEFKDFIDWLNLKDNEDSQLVKNIRYLVIAGDLVDGIGIYPSQFDELNITDIYKQYEVFENFILKIPKHIDIFITSGNHDAVRLSDPQPAIPEMFLPRLYKEEHIHILGSPTWVDFEGFKTIIYHGAALHGIYKEIKEATMDKPDLAIKELIKRRDIMPQYGDRQTFIPIEKNFMTLTEIPDIYIGADVHHHGYSKYKHCHLINASCWQSMTSYQKEKGHIPTLAKVILFNFKDQKITIKDFYKKKENDE